MSANPSELAQAALKGEREIVTTRLINAPRDLVFSAWADTEHVGKWWGPNGFTTTTHKREFKPGGVWDFVMHGPDGHDYVNKVIYSEIVPPEYIVHLHYGDEGAVQFHARTTFQEVDGKTLITMHTTLPSRDVRDMVVEKYGALEGGKQTLTRFAEFVESIKPKS